MKNSNELDYLSEWETDRLILRPHIAADVKDWVKFMEHTKCIEFFPDFQKGNPLYHAQNWMQRLLARYEAGTYGHLAMIEKTSGNYIGQCGLLLQDIDGIDELEIGYALLYPFWGKGYASEAAQFFKNYAFERVLSDSLISLIHVKNEGSKRVAMRNGMTLDKSITWRALPIDVFRVSK